MADENQVDIFADENQPRVHDGGKITMYRIDIPNHHFDYYVVLWAREDGYAEIHEYKFHGVRGPDHERDNFSVRYEREKEVWDWLMEWELVELKPIGPEDSEYFITDLLQKEAAKANQYDEEAGW